VIDSSIMFLILCLDISLFEVSCNLRHFFNKLFNISLSYSVPLNIRLGMQ